MTKELLYAWVANGFHVLVPKKRGEGFLKQPYGHHHNEALTDIANQVGCDLCGLDGSLEFEGPDTSRLYHGKVEAKSLFVASVMPRLEAYYQMPSREIDQRTFWGCHRPRIRTENDLVPIGTTLACSRNVRSRWSSELDKLGATTQPTNWTRQQTWMKRKDSKNMKRKRRSFMLGSEHL